MKRLFLIPFFIFTIILLTGCETDKNGIVDISYSKFNSMISNNDSFILEIVQTGCSNCMSFTPTFKEILKENNIKAYSINITDLSENDANDFLDKYNVDGTPTVIFFEKGVDKGTTYRIVGNQKKSVIIAKLKKSGYISE